MQHRPYLDVEEDTVYLQLLLITVASLVLVVFVVSVIFSCWWIKSRQDSLESGKYSILLPILFLLGRPLHALTSHVYLFMADFSNVSHIHLW